MAETKNETKVKAADAVSVEDAEALAEELRKAVYDAEVANSGQLGSAQAVAEAAGRANQERQTTAIGERQAAISVGNDPETADDEGGKEAGDGAFAGQLFSSDHYAAVTTEYQGRQVVEVRPAGWVGPGFEFPASRVKEVAKLLGGVKNLPKQD